ncbi:DMT family transporter [Amaricoccus tamworthensis]|uniref:DMT family transporter n=1 Tax=Amaricoccus tamworthensis TaxID=57002 RepID=UPI003C7D4406
MTGSILSFTAMAVAGRDMLAEMNTFELMLYRSFIGFGIVCLVIQLQGLGFSQVLSHAPLLHVKRNLFHFFGQNMWFAAVTMIPLAQLVALEMTNPIWVAVLAPFFLGEVLTRVRIIAALLGFTGILIVAQPGLEPVNLGHAAALMAAIGFAMNTIYTKQIMQRDSVNCVLFWMTLSQGVMALFLSLPGGIPWPATETVPSVIVVAATGLSAHFCLTSALRNAPATIVAPMEFMRLPTMATAGFLIYGESIRVSVFVGAALIAYGILLNVNRESRTARAARQPKK